MKKKRFQVGESFYEIPDNEVQSFLSDNPKAVEVKYYELDGGKYNIPIAEVDSFENEMGLKKKETSNIGSLVGGLFGTGGEGRSVSGGVVGKIGNATPKTEESKIAAALATVGTSKDQTPLQKEVQPGYDPNDPVKSIYAPVRNKLAALRQRPVAESVAQDPLLKQRQSEEVTAALNEKSKLDATPVFGHTNEAAAFIEQRLDPSKLVSTKPMDMMQRPSLDDFTEESIIAAIPKGNETVELGVKKYLDNRKVKESIYSSNNLGDAAVKLAALKGDLTSKQIQQLGGNIPKSMQANLLIGLLNDENTRELAENDAELNSKIMETVYNLPDTHPQAAARYLIQTLSQEREDRGLNNAVLNFTSVGTNDDIINDLVEKGKLSAQYKNMYDNPSVKFYVNSKLKTPGLIENVASGIESGLTGWGKSTQEVGILGSTIDNSKKQLYDALDKEYQQVALKPKSLIHDITMTGGNIVGQIIPIAAGGNYLQAAKIVTNANVANSIAIGMQTYGDYKEQARKDMPDASEMEQTAKALLDTGIEMATENIVNDTKLVKQAVSKYSPEIQDVIKKFTAKEISREAAKSQVNDIFSRVLEQAKAFGSKTGKIVKGEANEELSASVLQNANNQIFGGEEKSVPQMADEAFEVWKTTLFGGIPLGAIGGVSALKKNKPATELIYDVAGNPEKYIPLVQEQAAVNDEYAAQAADILDNIEYASKVRKALDKSTDITEAQKKRFLVASINANNLQKEAEKIPDPVLRKPIEKEIEKATEEKEKALTEIEEEEVSEFTSRPKEEILVDVPAAAAAIQDENIKSKIVSNPEIGLAEIAQQLHSTEGEASTATKVFGRDLSDLALEMYRTREDADAALQQATQPPISQERELDMGTELVAGQPSISVQMPGEVKKPEVVEPQTAEEVVEDMTPFVETTRPELAFDEVDTAVLDNMDSKTMAVQGKRLEGINKNLGKLKELFDCIWS